ncbi:MAG: hypothetical protein ACPG49_12810 [Chitinophagales bacterium]
MNFELQQEKFWNEVEESCIPFIADNKRIRAYIEARLLKLMRLIMEARKGGYSSMIFFDLLEKIAFKIIEIEGVESLSEVYNTEAGWLKTEIKNTLNFICYDAYEVGIEGEE